MQMQDFIPLSLDFFFIGIAQNATWTKVKNVLHGSYDTEKHPYFLSNRLLQQNFEFSNCKE